MIKEVTMYRVLCDVENCDASPQDGDYWAWAQRDIALQDAVDADWYVVTDKAALCTEHRPECAEPDCGVALVDDEHGTYCADDAAAGTP